MVRLGYRGVGDVTYNKDGSELSNHPHEEEEEAAGVAGLSRGVAGERDDADVLTGRR